MRSLSTARLLATVAAVAGTGLLGTALGGMAAVDRELAASVAPTPQVQYDRVAYERERVDCQPEARTSDARSAI